VVAEKLGMTEPYPWEAAAMSSDEAIFQAQVSFQPKIWGVVVPGSVVFHQGLPSLNMHLGESAVTFTTNEKGLRTFFDWDSGTYPYNEIKRLESVSIPRWLSLRTIDPSITKFGIRLDRGESRTEVIIFSNHYGEIVDEFARHGVKLDPNSRKLGFMFLGFR
jgi:hypothetical protein